MQMNWAESIYINSGLRTKRLRRSVIPKLIALGGRTEGLEVLDIGLDRANVLPERSRISVPLVLRRSTSIRRWSNEPVTNLSSTEIE